MLAANVPEGPTADTWDNSELKAGWAETGTSDAWDLIDDKIAPAPAALPPTVGAREVDCPAPANKDEAADDRLGASVPDGPTADTCERRDESNGRIELGRFDAWEANEEIDEPIAPALPVANTEVVGRLATCEINEESGGWLDNGSWLIWELKDDRADCTAGAVGPLAETWDSSEDNAGWRELGSWDVNAGLMLTAPSVGTLVVMGARPEIWDTKEDKPGWAAEGNWVICELKDDNMGWTLEGTAPEADSCDKSDETGAKIELGSCAVNAGSIVMLALMLAVAWGTADLVKSEAWETILDKIGCAETGISVTWEANEDKATPTPLAAGPEAEICEIKLEIPSWIEPGSAVAWDAKEVSMAPISTPGVIWGTVGFKLIRSEACETIADSAGCADIGNSVIWDPRDETATLTPLASGPEADIWEIKLETSGCNDAGRAVACDSKELRTAPISTAEVIWGVSELTRPDICATIDDNVGWADAGSSVIWETKEDRAELTPLAAGPDALICESSEETSGWIEPGRAVTSAANEVSIGLASGAKVTW
jgi:hypothetical protein